MAIPETIGELAAAALATAAGAGLNEAVKGAAKDAYEALKRRLWARAATEITSLEEMPTSKDKMEAISRIIETFADENKEEIRTIVKLLLKELHTQFSPVGIDISELTARVISIGNVRAVDGRGARIHKSAVDSLSTGNIHVSSSRGK